MTFRGLSFRECWRFGGEPLKFAICLVLKAIGKQGEEMILPAHANEREVAETEISDTARSYLQAHIAKAAELGYSRRRWVTLVQPLPKTSKESYGGYCLHDDGVRVLFIAYLCSVATGVPRYKVVVSGLLARGDASRELFSAERAYFDCPYITRHRVSRHDVATVDAMMQARLAQGRSAALIVFGKLPDFTGWMNQANVRSFDDKIERGLYHRVGNLEIR